MVQPPLSIGAIPIFYRFATSPWPWHQGARALAALPLPPGTAKLAPATTAGAECEGAKAVLKGIHMGLGVDHRFCSFFV